MKADRFYERRIRVMPRMGLTAHDFPIDMLRYDQGHPTNESDSHLILRCLGEGVPMAELIEAGGIGITLRMAAENPTFRRWESFGWVIVKVGEVWQADATRFDGLAS